MAKELGDRVKLQSPVYRVDQSGDMVVVETLDKQTYMVRLTKRQDESAAVTQNRKKTHPEHLYRVT